MNRQDKLRLIAASAILVAVPCYVICGLNHLCMDGHMEHPPYPSIDWLNDAAWVAAMVLSAAAGWKSNLTFKRSVLTGMILLLVSRLVLGSGGSFLFLLELPVVFAVTFTALFGFFFRDIDKSGLTSEQRRTHRRRIPRNWVGTLATLTIVLLSCYATIRIRDFIRVKSAPRIAITGNAIPGPSADACSPS